MLLIFIINAKQRIKLGIHITVVINDTISVCVVQ